MVDLNKPDSGAIRGRRTAKAGGPILIVDDQADIRRLLGISLGADHDLIEASDGQSALRMVESHRPSLVLLDVMLQGDLDGLQVLERIRARPDRRRTVVAMISARSQVTDQHAALSRGADAYFTKPFSPLAVRSWIRDALETLNPASDFTPL